MPRPAIYCPRLTLTWSSSTTLTLTLAPPAAALPRDRHLAVIAPPAALYALPSWPSQALITPAGDLIQDLSGQTAMPRDESTSLPTSLEVARLALRPDGGPAQRRVVLLTRDAPGNPLLVMTLARTLSGQDIALDVLTVPEVAPDWRPITAQACGVLDTGDGDWPGRYAAHLTALQGALFTGAEITLHGGVQGLGAGWSGGRTTVGPLDGAGGHTLELHVLSETSPTAWVAWVRFPDLGYSTPLSLPARLARVS